MKFYWETISSSDFPSFVDEIFDHWNDRVTAVILREKANADV
jgi:hypothetical protein